MDEELAMVREMSPRIDASQLSPAAKIILAFPLSVPRVYAQAGVIETVELIHTKSG